jgi:hypothetical protein
LGAKKTTRLVVDGGFDTCRPCKSGSDESCRITLAAPARLFTMVRGFASQSNAYILTIAAEGGAE